jgi:hypothetical protein
MSARLRTRQKRRCPSVHGNPGNLAIVAPSFVNRRFGEDEMAEGAAMGDRVDETRRVRVGRRVPGAFSSLWNYRIYKKVFAWDIAKALANFEKHGVSFEEAATVFADLDGLEWKTPSIPRTRRGESAGSFSHRPGVTDRLHDQEVER